MQVPWYKNIKRRLCPAIPPWQTNLELTHQATKWPGPPRDNHPLPRFRPWVAGPAHPRCIIHGNGYYPQPPHSRFPGTRWVYCSFHTRIYFHLSPHKHLSKSCRTSLEIGDGNKVVWMRQKPATLKKSMPWPRGWAETKTKVGARTEIWVFGLGLQEIPPYRLKLPGRKEK